MQTTQNRFRVLALVPLLALSLTSCQELAVTNPNLPDALRATQQPTAAETFVASAFRTWWPVGGHDDYPGVGLLHAWPWRSRRASPTSASSNCRPCRARRGTTARSTHAAR